MLKDIVSVLPLEQHRLRITFDDGIEGEIDILPLIAPLTGVFSPLSNQEFFRQVSINPDLGTLCWPNGADLDPNVLYALVTGQSLPGEAQTVSTPQP
jgi:hypothetical protein